MMRSLAIMLVIGLYEMECWEVEQTWLVGEAETLNCHNEKRFLHVDTPPLKGSFQLALSAKDCIVYMIKNNLEPNNHPCNPENDFQGENIYLSKTVITPNPSRYLAPATNGWYAEIDFLNLNDPFVYETLNKGKVGHFTQMIWAETSLVGCAGGSYIPDTMRRTLIVCRYKKPGNEFYGKALRENVHKLKEQGCKDANPALCGEISVDPKRYCNGPFKDVLMKHCQKSCGVC